MSDLKIGLVGCGAFGEEYLAALAGLAGVEAAAVTDIVPERATALAERYGVPHVASNADELAAHGDIDAVAVVTTESQHLAPVLAALHHGKHVIVEKPMATNLAEAQAMVEAARETGLVLMPGHLLRFEPRYATVKQQLDAGRLGRPLCLTARRNRPRSLGKIYKRTPLAFEMAIHDVDLMRWFTGQAVTSVRAWEVAAEPGDGADVLCATLRFADGAVGMLETSWLLPDKAALLDDGMEILTTSGAATVDVLDSGLSVWTEAGVEGHDISYAPRLRGHTQGALRDQLAYFARCCRENVQPSVVTAEDGLEAVRLCLAIIESVREDREVRLESH